MNNELIQNLRSCIKEITPDILDSLRARLSKQEILDVLDIDKKADGSYVSSNNTRVSFRSNINISNPNNTFDLSPIHLYEITKCASDLDYFIDNYVKVRNLKGIGFYERTNREYQENAFKILQSDAEQIVMLMGRQCVDGNTLIETKTGKIKIKDAFEPEMKNEIA